MLLRCIASVGVLVASSGIGFSAYAADLEESCQVFVKGNWVSHGTTPLDSCLEAIEADVPNYGRRGFKFGKWGDAILSADRSAFYLSEDDGSTWRPLGQKADVLYSARALVNTPAPEPEAEAAAAESAPSKPDLTLSTTLESAETGDVAPEQPLKGLPPPAAVASSIPLPADDETFYGDDASTAARIAETTPPTAAQQDASILREAPAEPIRRNESPEMHACNIKFDGEWKLVGAYTLKRCAAELRASAGTRDERGYKYGYWGRTYLIASDDGVLIQRGRGADLEDFPASE